jgi:hypothetical protein
MQGILGIVKTGAVTSLNVLIWYFQGGSQEIHGIGILKTCNINLCILEVTF